MARAAGAAMRYGARPMSTPSASERAGPRRWPAAAAAALALAGPAALFLVRAGLDESRRLWFVGRLLYWTMWPLLLFAAAAVWRCWRAAGVPLRARLRAHIGALVAAAALAGAVTALVPASLRVQWDETNLLSTSQNMHVRRAAFVSTQAVPLDGEPLVLECMVDKRPPLFPFLVSLLHDVRGFRVGHAFAVNAAVLAAVLLAVQTAVRRHLGLGAVAAAAAAALVAGAPLAIVGATSAGFELLAAALLAATLLAAAAFVRAPSSAGCHALAAAGLLFCYARYESVLVFAVVLALALW